MHPLTPNPHPVAAGWPCGCTLQPLTHTLWLQDGPVGAPFNPFYYTSHMPEEGTLNMKEATKACAKVRQVAGHKWQGP